MNGYSGDGSSFVNDTNGQNGYTFQFSPTPEISSWDQSASNQSMVIDPDYGAMDPQHFASVMARQKLSMRHEQLQSAQSAGTTPETSINLHQSIDPFSKQVVGRGRGRVFVDPQPVSPGTLQKIADEMKRAKRHRLNANSVANVNPANFGQVYSQSEIAPLNPAVANLLESAQGGHSGDIAQGTGTASLSRVKLNPLAPPFGASNPNPALATGLGMCSNGQTKAPMPMADPMSPMMEIKTPMRMTDPKNPMVEAKAICEVYLEMGKRFAIMSMNQKKQLLMEIRKELGPRFHDATVDTVIALMAERFNARMREQTK